MQLHIYSITSSLYFELYKSTSSFSTEETLILGKSLMVDNPKEYILPMLKIISLY